MTLLVDAAPLVALANTADRLHARVLDALRSHEGRLVVPAPVSAEADYLLGKRLGRPARMALLADVAAGRFLVEPLLAEEYSQVLLLEDRYSDLDLGLADCALVVLAGRFETRELLTFDERHFRAVTPLQGGAFRILPADAES